MGLQKGKARSRRARRNQYLSYIKAPLIYGLILMMIFPNPSALYAAGITVDTNDPLTNAPTVDTAQNGVQVVNVADPSTRGVSSNKFSDYNVGSDGVILNNNTQVGISELGGALYANPNFSGSSASILLFEVTGSNRSNLEGYTEIFGQSAEFILANPNGIYVNGAGFINTPKATLTTGVPLMSGGALTGFQINQGHIQIEALGLNAANVDYFEILSRTIELNGELRVRNTASLIAGRNHYDYETGYVTALTPDGSASPTFAIDASALGAVLAGRIILLSTEKGVGVNSEGVLYAMNGDLTITSAGDVHYSQAFASTNVSIRAEGDISQSMDVQAGGVINLQASNNITIEGETVIAETVAITAGADLEIVGSIDTPLYLEANEFVLNADGSIGISDSDQLSNTSFMRAKDIITVANTEFNTSTLNMTAEGIRINNSSVLADYAMVSAGSDGIAATGSVLISSGLSMLTSGNVTMATSSANALENLLFSGMNMSFENSNVEAGEILSLTASEGVTVSDGSVLTATDLVLFSGGLFSNDGWIQSTNSLTLTADSVSNNATIKAGTVANIVANTVETSGTLESVGDLTVTANTFGNSGTLTGYDLSFATADGGLMTDWRNTDRLLANGQLSINTNTLKNLGGTVIALDTAVIDAGSLYNSGTLMTGGNLIVDASNIVDNDNGLIQSYGYFSIDTANSLSNKGGSIVSSYVTLGYSGVGTTFDETNYDSLGSFDLPSFSINRFSSESTLTQNQIRVANGALDNDGGEIRVDSSVVLDLFGDMDNDAGSISAIDALSIKTEGTINNLNSGSAVFDGIVAGGDMVLAAGAINNDQGKIESFGNMTIDSSGIINNKASRLYAMGDLHVGVEGDLINSDGGIIQSGDDIMMKISGVLLNSNTDGTYGVQSGDSLWIQAATINNNDGTIKSGGAFNMYAGVLDNESGLLSGGAGQSQLSVTGNASPSANGGIISVADALKVNMNQFVNAGGVLETGGKLDLGNTQYDNTDGNTHAGGGLETTSFDNQSGVLTGSGEIVIDMGRNDFNNQSGVIKVQGQGNLTIRAGGYKDNSSSWLESNGDVSVYLFDTYENAATWNEDYFTQGSDKLLVEGLFRNREAETTGYSGRAEYSWYGNVKTNGSFYFASTKRLNNHGTIEIEGDAILRNGGLSNYGTILTQDNFDQIGGSIVIMRDSELSVGGDLNLEAYGNISASGGKILSGGDITIKSDRTIMLDGTGSIGFKERALIYASGNINFSFMDYGTDLYPDPSYLVHQMTIDDTTVLSEGKISIYSEATRAREVSFFNSIHEGKMVPGGSLYHFRMRNSLIEANDTVDIVSSVVSLYSDGFIWPEMPHIHAGNMVRISAVFEGEGIGSVSNEGGVISSGGDMHIDTELLTNETVDDFGGLIQAQGTLSGTITTLENGGCGYASTGLQLQYEGNPNLEPLPLECGATTKSLETKGTEYDDSMAGYESLEDGTIDVTDYILNGAGTNGLFKFNTDPDYVDSSTYEKGVELDSEKSNGEAVAISWASGRIESAPDDKALQSSVVISRQSAPKHKYLIESDVQFLNKDNFLGSSYMLTRLGIDPDSVIKRLGDSVYETTLVRDAILRETGQRFLHDGVSSDKEQMKNLMDGAVAAQSDLQLTVGVALSKAQVQNLNQDIIWMVEQKVAGETVLVPQVYLTVLTVDAIKQGGFGASFEAGSFDLDIETLSNNGSMSADEANLRVSGDTNNAGSMDFEGGDVQLGQLNNTGSYDQSSGTLSVEKDLDNRGK
ncbi:filamentous hemagglutinin N-terminal domain-containing protein, partial [bacterium]|nr:filamentous hemagglutinin N-terminal domain-containing protein [bacterium]